MRHQLKRAALLILTSLSFQLLTPAYSNATNSNQMKIEERRIKVQKRHSVSDFKTYSENIEKVGKSALGFGVSSWTVFLLIVGLSVKRLMEQGQDEGRIES